MEKKERILIVDDDKILSEHLKAGLADENYQIVAVSKGSAAIELAKAESFNLAILDLVLPDIQGIDLMRALNQLAPHTNFIVLTGYATISSAIEALKVGAYDYLIKPFDLDHLKLVIRRGLEKQRLTLKNLDLLEKLEKEKIKLGIIMDAYNHISEIFRLDELADFVADKAVLIAEAERASLMIVDEGAGELVVRGFKGLDKEKKGLRMKIGQLVAGWVAQEGQVMLVKDIETDPRMRLQLKNPQYKTKSFISLPLKTDSQVVGVINVTDKLSEMEVFTDEDLRYLSLLAHQTVIQIANIRLCEKLSSLAVTDALTGIFNHRFFQEGLNVVRPYRSEDHPEPGHCLDGMPGYARRTELGHDDGPVRDDILQACCHDAPCQLIRAEGSLAGGAPDIDAFGVKDQNPGIQTAQLFAKRIE